MYLCPLCKTHGNELLPILSNELPRRVPTSAPSTPDWLHRLDELHTYAAQAESAAAQLTAAATAQATTTALGAGSAGSAASPASASASSSALASASSSSMAGVQPTTRKWPGASFGVHARHVDASSGDAMDTDGASSSAAAAAAATAAERGGTPPAASSSPSQRPLSASPFSPPARQPTDERRELGAFSTVSGFRRLISPRLPPLSSAATPATPGSPGSQGGRSASASASAESLSSQQPARMQRTGSRLAIVHDAEAPSAPAATGRAEHANDPDAANMDEDNNNDEDDDEEEDDDDDEDDEDERGAPTTAAAVGTIVRNRLRDFASVRNRIALARDILPLAWSLVKMADPTPSAAATAAPPPPPRDDLPEPIMRMLGQLNLRLLASLRRASRPELLHRIPALSKPGPGTALHRFLGAYLCTLQVIEAGYRGRRLPMRSQGTHTAWALDSTCMRSTSPPPPAVVAAVAVVVVVLHTSL